jgi:hypothetical protein
MTIDDQPRDQLAELPSLRPESATGRAGDPSFLARCLQDLRDPALDRRQVGGESIKIERLLIQR